MAVSTQTLREEYPEAITQWDPLRCDYSETVAVRFPAKGSAYPLGYVNLKIHPALVDGTRALAAVMLFYDYSFEETAGGTLSCRAITGGSNTSGHAHAVCLDFNPSKNGYRHVVGALDDPDTEHQEGLLQWGRYTNMPAAMIRAIKAIKTISGARFWAWGGDWWNIKDPMHFQPAAHRDSIEAGLDTNTVEGLSEYLAWAGIEEEEMPEGFLPLKFNDGTGDREHKKSDVAAVAAMMERAYGIDLDNDGHYDEKMKAAVAEHLGDNGSSIYGNLYDNLVWDLAVAAAKTVTPPASGMPEFEVETVSVVKGIKVL